MSLPNPRHEAFALYLAAGHTPESAYLQAGFSSNNVKARAKRLAKDPDIRDRVADLRPCLPRIADLHHRFAPSLMIMPETRQQMIAWLWQVMSGTRRLQPLQFRAAALFARLNGWHLTKPIPPDQEKPAVPLTSAEAAALAAYNTLTAEADTACQPVDKDHLHHLYSALADLALASLRSSDIPVAGSPEIPQNNDQKSPSYPIDPQPTTPLSSPSGDKNESAPDSTPPSISFDPPTPLHSDDPSNPEATTIDPVTAALQELFSKKPAPPPSEVAQFGPNWFPENDLQAELAQSSPNWSHNDLEYELALSSPNRFTDFEPEPEPAAAEPPPPPQPNSRGGSVGWVTPDLLITA